MGKNSDSIYDVIVIGAGASGLFYGACESLAGTPDTCHLRKLILEKTEKAGQKLLMSGNGMCNITHGGSIKDFVDRYGEHGRAVRSCLYRHNNLELMKTMEKLDVPVIEREDGKVFPTSMKAKDVLDALLAGVRKGGWEIRYGAEVVGLRSVPESTSSGKCLSVLVLSDGTTLRSRKLVIACGGSSYPSTGSDGTFLEVMKRDLGLNVVEPRPALTPVYVQDFNFGGIAGVSFTDVSLKCGTHTTRGPMLITHKGFSGPAVLHISQYVKTGDTLMINFIPQISSDDVLAKIKEDAPGNKTGVGNYIAASFGLPRSFVDLVVEHPERKLCQINSGELARIASMLTSCSFSVSGTGGWNDAMVTAGGVALDQIDMKTMRIKTRDTGEVNALPDIRIIGETLDVNGDTGGYNLQFAYSSAMAAVE